MKYEIYLHKVRKKVFPVIFLVSLEIAWSFKAKLSGFLLILLPHPVEVSLRETCALIQINHHVFDLVPSTV